MSRYQGYYRKKQYKNEDATPWPPSESESAKSIKASTSRETPFYEEPSVTLAKWRSQMQEVFSPQKMREFAEVKSKEDFDDWMLKHGITNPRTT